MRAEGLAVVLGSSSSVLAKGYELFVTRPRRVTFLENMLFIL
jgi:hypothetical protein